MEKLIDIKSIPQKPGCYLFRNRHRQIIYIGKSKSLHNRVKQYFYSTNSTDYNKYTELAKEVYDIETIITDTETNALILECQLIKEHKPRYNSQLKDAKSYPYIRIDTKQVYPTIKIVDIKQNDNCKYFGSFYSKNDAIRCLELLNGIWQIPLCSKSSFSGKNKPCLNHHIDKCCAPCGALISSKTYIERISEIVKCLNGHYAATFNRLSREMKVASKKLEFEKAARIRDSIIGLSKLHKKQKQLYTNFDNKDVYLFFRALNEQCFSLFLIRNGETLKRLDFPSLVEPSDELFEEFIHYDVYDSISVDDGSFLTSCLLDIVAQKYFVPVSKRSRAEQIIRKLRDAFVEFILDSD